MNAFGLSQALPLLMSTKHTTKARPELDEHVRQKPCFSAWASRAQPRGHWADQSNSSNSLFVDGRTATAGVFDAVFVPFGKIRLSLV